MTGHHPADRCKIPAAFWRAVERAGLPPAAVLRQARLPASLFLDDRAFVNTGHYFALWRALEELSHDPAFGLKMVQLSDPSGHPPAFLAAYYARDYRDALARTARFKRLCTPEQLLFDETGTSVVVTTKWLFTAEPEPTIATDVAFATLVTLGRLGTGQPLAPLGVELTRPAPGGGGHETFFACPVAYGAERNALILKPCDLDRPFPGHNPELLAMLGPALSAALEELEAHALPAQVKAVLKRTLASGRPEVLAVARELGLSERTLQRRITEAGTTFRDLLAEARRDLGLQLLSDPAADIDEIACLLGYQDTRSFYRAFRQWEGVPPIRWRELKSTMDTERTFRSAEIRH